ncbi:hypothetical protein CR513_07498, partial [Mucuna pruriens]
MMVCKSENKISWYTNPNIYQHEAIRYYKSLFFIDSLDSYDQVHFANHLRLSEEGRRVLPTLVTKEEG